MALDLPVYTKTVWAAEMPITADRMNNLEDTVKANRDALISHDEVIDSLDTRISDRVNLVTTGIAANAQLGAEAKAEIAQATTGHTPVYTSLDARFKALDDALGYIQVDGNTTAAFYNGHSVSSVITSMQNLLSGALTEIQNARIDGVTNVQYTSLALHLLNIDQNINLLHANVADINNAAGAGMTLAERINQLQLLQNEIDAAHREVQSGQAADTLAKRFADLDTQISTLFSNVGSLGDNKVNVADIINDLIHTDTNKPLSANMGKTLRDLIGGTYDSTNTVTAAITSAASTAEANAKAYADQKDLDAHISEINAAHRNGSDTLDARFDDIETEINTAHRDLGTDPETEEVIVDSLNKRFLDAEADIAALQTEVAATHTENAQNLNSRLTAIETNAAAIASDLHAIATELAMLDDQDAIKNTNTKIDDLEADIQSFARELAMARDENGRLVETSTRVDSLETQASNMANAISHAADGNDPGGLTERIVALETEPKSATEVVAELPQTGDATKDYLVGPNEDGKYFYYKWIANEWQLISGDSGGSSSALIVAALPEPSAADANIDYYVGNSTDGYTHYRFVAASAGESEGHFIRILPNNLIGDISVDQYGGLVAHTINDNQTNLLNDFYALNGVTYTPNYDPNDASVLVSQTLQFTGTDGQQLDPIVIVGGGGSGGSVYTVRIETTTDAVRSIPANSTDPVTIRAKVVMKQGNDLVPGATATGQLQYRVYGASNWNMGERIEVTAVQEALRYTIQNDTYFTVDISKYLQVDKTMQFRLVISAHPEDEETEVIRYQTYTVSKVNISIASEAFDYGSVKNSNFQFNYRCFGSGISKTVHFLVDGTDAVTPVTTSSHNTVLQQIIPMTGKSNGMHTFQVYFVTSTGLKSNKLNYFILYNTDATRQAPLIGAAAANPSIVDGDELVVNYSVNTIGSETTDRVEIELYTMDNGNKNVIQTNVLTNVTNNKLADPPYSTFNYPKVVKTGEQEPDPITVYVKFTAYNGELSDSQTIQVSVAYLNTTYSLEPAGENNLIYKYDAYGRSNNQADKDTYIYTYTAVNGQAINFETDFNNFNWATDGYVDGKCLTIGGGATVDINVPIFSSSYNGTIFEENANVRDITQIGRTIEIDYEVLSATNLNATIIDCMSSNNIGFRVTPQSCYLLNSGSNIDIDETGFIKNEENVAAAYLNPGTRTHLTFVIEPWAIDKAADGNYHQSTNIYINGEFANSCPYNRNSSTGNLDGNNFSTNATITIGSDSCLIKLYSVKLYNRGLTESQVLHNYEVAPVAIRDKLARLEDNDVLNAQGLVDYEKARRKYTCLLLTGQGTVNGVAVPTMAPYKGYPSVVGRIKDGEVVGKTESGLLLTKPSNETPEGYVVEFDLQDKLVDPNGYGYASSNNVQGTSSQKFPVKNLKVYLAKGKPGTEVYDSDDPETRKVVAYTKSDKVKYALRGSEGIGESTLCWKADYMSTDHANTFNANIANTLYNPNEDKLSDRWTEKTQYAVYGIKCLLFQKNGEDGIPEFVGDGCLNNDKGNHKTFGLETDTDDGNDTMCQKWDFRNNTNSLLFFKHDGLFETVDGKPAAASCLECIYPDEGDLADAQDLYKKENSGATNPKLNVNYNHFQILSSWLGNRANYWYETDTTIRNNKKNIFINEFRNHFNFNHILIYYLFMEYTALCDNRVKNIHMRTDNAGEERIRIKDTDNFYFEGNNNPNSGPWTIAANLETRIMQEPLMDENGNYQFDQSGNMVLGNVNHVFVKDEILNTIDWQQGEDHSNFAIWAPVLYDLDSCFGAENVGYLKVRYDADWNYSLYNKLQFAGFDSILWLQVEDCFQNELKAMAKTLYNRVVGLNYSTFYRRQIIDNLASLSPAVTNQDMILKYEKPWTEGFLDYTNDPPTQSTDKYKYLQRGTRTAQKATFMKQRSMLMASKYDGNEFKQDKITFRAGTVVNHDNAVITLTANQKLYHGVQFGDLNDVSKVTRRAYEMYNSATNTWIPVNDNWIPEFVPCRVKNIGDMGNTDGIEIYGASVLNDIGDLSRFHPYQLKIGNAVNLKKLIIGSDVAGFSNTSTADIDGLNACVLLEEINVCNLKNLTSLSLSNNGFIKKVYATGSGLNTLSLPSGGVLDTIAYGENITDITIINQSRLTNFSYENSSTNNYGNVTRLWIENTPNVPVREIIAARLTPISSSDHGLRAGGLRVVGIDLDLGNDPSFLQLITSDLVMGTYLTAQGGHTEGNDQPPYISGKIHITEIRASLLAKVNEMYPDLIVYNTIDAEGNPNNNVITEYTITYLNYDMDENNPLYVDYRVSGENVIDPVYDINPVTNTYYIDMPTKPEDAQYKYKFGTYDSQNKYRRFSGWVIKNTTTNPTSSTKVNGNVIYVAYFPTVRVQQYTVKWFDAPNGTQLNSVTVDYNADLSAQASPIELGTLARTNISGNLVKVFSGWSRPLGKITSNVNVYAQWETSTINNDTPSISMNTLTAADIYALSLVDNSRKAALLASQLGTPIFIKMGQDFNYTEGVEVTDLLEGDDEIILDGTSDPVRVYNAIKPLAINSDWTFAIDYKLLMDSAASFNNGQEFVLASCYQNANSSIQGFKISVVRGESSSEHNIQVTWGTTSTVIDFALTDTSAPRYFTSYRNVVVLSHNSDTPNVLRVSYVKPTTNNTYAPINANYGTFVNNELLTWNSNVEIDKPLIIGGNYAGMTTTIEEEDYTRRPAQGIVYWAKFWNTDLGETNCGKLASWIHETVPFLLSGYNDGASSATEQVYTGSELSFVAAQGMGDRYLYARRNNGATDSDGYYGWHLSDARTICNSLIYSGMPEAYKSIIRSTPVRSVKRDIELRTNTYGTTNDYLFLPAYREVYEGATTDGYGATEIQASWSSPWHWMVPANLTVLTYQAGSSQNVESRAASSVSPYRYRFSGAYISDNNRIFDIDDDPTSKTLYYVNNGTTSIITVQPGDIWVTQDNTAYMYLSRTDIERGVSYDTMAANNTGAWKRANMWNLRTFSASTSAVENGFMRVNVDGAVETQIVVTQFATEGRLLCPEFTV